MEAESETNYFKKIENQKLYLMKEKQIYLQLNEMELYNNFLQGEIYVRKADVEELQRHLLTFEKEWELPAAQLIGMSPVHLPTHFIKNNYTSSAQ